MKKPLWLAVAGEKAFWSTGAIGLRSASVLSQTITIRKHYPVREYKSIEEITEATQKLKWTSDPWDGKLDVLKHPTFMEEALVEHPDYSGDCDDFAGYWAAALLKNKLAHNVVFASAQWEEKGKITGHAFCIFWDKNNPSKCWWVGNFDKCTPIACDAIMPSQSWIKGMEERVKAKMLVAGYVQVDLHSDDTILFGKAYRAL